MFFFYAIVIFIEPRGEESENVGFWGKKNCLACREIRVMGRSVINLLGSARDPYPSRQASDGLKNGSSRVKRSQMMMSLDSFPLPPHSGINIVAANELNCRILSV